MVCVKFVPALLLLLLAACGDRTDTPYFPLRENLMWDYRVTEESARGTFERSMTITNLGLRTVGGDALAVRRTSSGTEYFFQHDEHGIQRVAKRLLIELEAKPDVPARTVFPASLEVGAQWQSSTHPYV
ncbi:MAG: hypothetical protein ACREXT_15340, partial [Gammaproteobacteria bacterium]